MLRITKLSDYAIVVLTDLALPPDPSAGTTFSIQAASDIARRTSIPQPTVSKVLKRLARTGVVLSERGKKGGYRLARLPREISLVDIIDAVEGQIAVTECTTDTTSCELEGNCAVEANWVRINDVVRRALAGVSLAEMARPMAPAFVSLTRLSARAAARGEACTDVSTAGAIENQEETTT